MFVLVVLNNQEKGEKRTRNKKYVVNIIMYILLISYHRMHLISYLKMWKTHLQLVHLYIVCMYDVGSYNCNESTEVQTLGVIRIQL